MKTLLAVALLTSPIAVTAAFAANEPKTAVQEVRVKKAEKAEKVEKAEQEAVYELVPKSSVGVSVRIKSSWADIYLRFNIG